MFRKKTRKKTSNFINHNLQFLNSLPNNEQTQFHRKIGDTLLKKNFKKFIKSRKQYYRNYNNLLNNTILEFEGQNKNQIDVNTFAKKKNRDPNNSYRKPYGKQLKNTLNELNDISINKKLLKKYKDIFSYWVSNINRNLKDREIDREINKKKISINLKNIFYNFIEKKPHNINFFQFNLNKLGPYIDNKCRYKFYNKNLILDNLTEQQELWCQFINYTIDKIIKKVFNRDTLQFIRIQKKRINNMGIDQISKDLNLNMLDFIILLNKKL